MSKRNKAQISEKSYYAYFLDGDKFSTGKRSCEFEGGFRLLYLNEISNKAIGAHDNLRDEETFCLLIPKPASSERHLDFISKILSTDLLIHQVIEKWALLFFALFKVFVIPGQEVYECKIDGNGDILEFSGFPSATIETHERFEFEKNRKKTGTQEIQVLDPEDLNILSIAWKNLFDEYDFSSLLPNFLNFFNEKHHAARLTKRFANSLRQLTSPASKQVADMMNKTIELNRSVGHDVPEVKLDEKDGNLIWAGLMLQEEAAEIISKVVTPGNRLDISLSTFYDANLSSHEPFPFISTLICLESLFSDGSSEMTEKLASRVSWFLHYHDPIARKEIHAQVKEMYRARSKIVHGAKLFWDISNYREIRQNSADITQNILKPILLNTDFLRIFCDHSTGWKKRYEMFIQQLPVATMSPDKLASNILNPTEHI